MKKILMTIVAAFAMAFAGCDNEPSVEEMTATATSVGKAAGYVANQTKIDDKSREVVIEIMTNASKVVPGKDQSFADAWSPIAKEITEKLVSEGKINKTQSAIITSAFAVACKGLDYLVTVRFPTAKKYENLVSAGAKGFTGGFLDVFRGCDNCVDGGVRAAKPEADFDKDAYEYLKASEAISK